MNSHPPPIALRIAAALAIVFGAASVIGMVASIYRGNFSIDLSFVGIPIGRGLLAGRPSSRSWALGFSGFGLVLVPTFAWWGFQSGEFRAAVGDQLRPYAIYLSLAFLVCATVFVGLCLASVREWFQVDSSSRSDVLGWTLPLVLVGVFFAAAAEIKDYITAQSLNGLFPVRTQFKFRDAVTGGPVRSVGYSSDQELFSSGRESPLRARLSFSTWSGTQGIAIELTGFSGRPVGVTFTSEGYQPAKYTLDAKTPDEVTLSLEPLKKQNP